jgi:hypothetical protein
MHAFELKSRYRFMKMHFTHLYPNFYSNLMVAVCLTSLALPSHAEVQLPYWLSPSWIQAKVMDFHVRNSERYELAQQQIKQSQFAEKSILSTASADAAPESTLRKTGGAPVETVVPKVNEKYLSKEELLELRRQLQSKR